MASTLSWIDHDSAERERMQRVLQLFRERDTRDELGLGGIRDSFSDALFPGTSTIQTRLRYFLFIPWVYGELERRRVPSERFAADARKLEMKLRDALLEGDDTAGVFGKEVGRALKRLASSVYWAGLGAWGLRRFQQSQDEYHRSIGTVYERRRLVVQRDDGERGSDPGSVTWHPGIPAPPEGFPERCEVGLTKVEAEFLRDRIALQCKGSLLAVLSARAEAPIADIRFPWEHPELATFSDEQRSLLHQARLFSQAMNGAAILYNVLLAELAQKEKLREDHVERLSEWAGGLDLRALRAWRLEDLWATVLRPGHAISAPAQRFVTDWLAELLQGPGELASNKKACCLVRRREMSLKGAHSRFTNRRALDQWGGRSGVDPLDFRWPITRRLLGDLHAGLSAG